jgi:DNA-binding transcriptional regulator of glucitol operon
MKMGKHTIYYYKIKGQKTRYYNNLGKLINRAIIDEHGYIKNGKLRLKFKIKSYKTYL